MTRFLTAVCALVVFSISAGAQSTRTFLPASLSYLAPTGLLADSLGAAPGLGFSLGYEVQLDRHHWRAGVRGTWMQSSLGSGVAGDDFSKYMTTYYQLLATVRYSMFKHGWTPYLKAEAGLGYITLSEVVNNMPIRLDDVSAVRGSFGGSVGVLIPLSDVLDVDISGRYSYAAIDDGYALLGVHAGVSYTLLR